MAAGLQRLLLQAWAEYVQTQQPSQLEPIVCALAASMRAFFQAVKHADVGAAMILDLRQVIDACVGDDPISSAKDSAAADAAMPQAKRALHQLWLSLLHHTANLLPGADSSCANM